MASDSPEEIRDLLAMHLVPGLGPKLTAALLKHFGSARRIRQASPDQLRQVPLIGEKLSEHFASALARVEVECELEQIQKHGITVVPQGGSAYPEWLAAIPDPPPLLYTRGTIEPADRRAVAIVGSRGCTGYGRRVTEQLVGRLVAAGYTIVSGLARGIDGVAHKAALNAGGRTLAVLAGGLSRIYPPEHIDLAESVAGQGALISEAPMLAEPLPAMFPPRNRIISGLSRAVIVVEAHEQSGTLITARHALDQGRLVFAVPGSIENAASAGCHRLIRDGATLIRSSEDVLEDLQSTLLDALPGEAEEASGESQPGNEPVSKASEPPPDLDPAGLNIWQLLGEGPRHVDELVREVPGGIADLTRLLTRLELKRVVRRLPGNRYERGC